MAHEMGHCVASESGLVLNEDFRTAIGFDMKNRKPESVVLAAETQRLMIDALKSYPADKIISELFARYFELLSTSRDVEPNGSFLTAQVMDFFVNTTKWIGQVFNPHIQSQIDKDIAAFTADLVANKNFKTEKKFADAEKSFHKKLKCGTTWSKKCKLKRNGNNPGKNSEIENKIIIENLSTN